MRTIKAFGLGIALLLVVLAGVLLWVENHTPVSLRLLRWHSPELPILVWLYGTFSLGVLTGFALCSFGFVRGKLEQRRLKHSLRDRERELQQPEAM